MTSQTEATKLENNAIPITQTTTLQNLVKQK